MAAHMTASEVGEFSGNSQVGVVEPSTESQISTVKKSVDQDGEDDEDEDQEEEDEEEEEDDDDREPTLKYAKLTPSLSQIYRNGDSTSASLASEDKMIIGTHGGNVHILSIPTLHIVRSYRAHSSSVTGISVSPFSPLFSNSAAEPSSKAGAPSQPKPNAVPAQSPKGSSVTPKNSPLRHTLQSSLASSVYIATSSIDGHVCVSSLVDNKDVTLRNYARPVHAVALSPSFKADRTYLSGGVAGNLILTVGGKVGSSADANTNSPGAAASGWLGTIGIGSATGKDSILHGGEGIITSIKWSLSGKYVVWNNEWGTRIMRSHLHLSSSESHLAWKRIGHVARPNRRIWEEMAGVWKARVEWIDEVSLQSPPSDSERKEEIPSVRTPSEHDRNSLHRTTKRPASQPERLMVGWGDTVWMLNIHDGASGPAQNGSLPARAEIVHQFMFSDCIVCGLALYTPSTLIALVYHKINPNASDSEPTAKDTPNRGKFRRKYGEPPDLRLIDLSSPDKEELEAESLVVSRYDQLTAADYSLSSLYVAPATKAVTQQRGTLGAFGDGLRDVSFNPTRLFSSGASILSGSSGDERATSPTSTKRVQSQVTEPSREDHQFLASSGLKVFIQSQFDCLIAVKRDRTDRLSWLLDREQYEEAWNMLNENPEILPSSSYQESRPATPTQSGQSLADFFEDETSSVTTVRTERSHQIAVEMEKHRIGGLWIQQLISQQDWSRAGQVAELVLGESPDWADWILTFANANKFEEITPHIPYKNLTRPLPSIVYDIVLGHYITHDIDQLQKLLDQWSPALFHVPTIITAIKNRLESDSAEDEALEDQVRGHHNRMLLNALARLYLADNAPSAAIRCYVRTRSADEALSLIHEYRMMEAVADEIFVFLTIRISPEKSSMHSLEELDELSKEPVRLLAAAAVQDIIEPSTVVSQLRPKEPVSRPYLFFYFRALWQGDTPEDSMKTDGTLIRPTHQRTLRFAAPVIASRTKIAPHDDLVVSLFAEYSQPLLNDFLQKSGRDYNLAHATQECRSHHLIPELVYLLKETGQTSEALHLIIDELDDVGKAVNFAKDADDESLWYDLLEYSMNKPLFIRGLLEKVGISASINPATLVRRIPEGMDIPDLKAGLARLVEDSKTSWSVTECASKILTGEVTTVLDTLRRNRQRGLVFDVSNEKAASHYLVKGETAKTQLRTDGNKSAECISCRIPLGRAMAASDLQQRLDYSVGFACGHLFHLSCLLQKLANDSNKAEIEKLRHELYAESTDFDPLDQEIGRVGTKMRHAQRIQHLLRDFACFECKPPVNEMKEDTQNG